MLFSFYCLDKPESAPLRADNRGDHLAYLDEHKERIVLAGPLLTEEGTTPIGSLLVLDLPNREAAETFAQGDPYAKAGVFASVTITPFRQVYPQG